MIYGQNPSKESRPVQTDATGRILTKEASIDVSAGGTSQKVAISTVSAQSTAIAAPLALVSPTVDCFMRQGANPTATNDGTDQFLFAGYTYRVAMTAGNKLAFAAASGTGNVYITPAA